MPADADLLCEYYLSSNLNGKKSISTPQLSSLSASTNGNTTKLSPNLSTSPTNNNNNNNNNNNQFEAIDFVKYDKSPMDYLKSKYKLLNSSNSSGSSSSTLSSASSSLTSSPVQQSSSASNTEASSPTTSPNHKSPAKDLNVMFKNSAWLDLNWSKIKKIGIGLYNLGNNCYLNATIQCLAYTPPLSQWLITKPHSPSCRFKQQKGFCSLCEVERIIYDIFNSANGCAKPNQLCFNIKKISAVFGVGTQEDASEFFTTLLESMAKSIKFTLNQNSSNNSNNNNTNNKRVTTILDDIFSFQFRSRITCGNCGRLSDTTENTNTWPIDVKYVQDIRKGMLHFLREEVLEGENAYKCDKCNRKTRATKKYSIRTAPNILVVHLKRFDFSYAGKLSHFVSYPENLSLKTLIPEESNGQTPISSHEKALRNVNYKLYGVLVHLGYTSHSGHYYSYVRGPNDVWYKADDQRISVVQSRDALGQNAYILFYSRISSNEDGPLSLDKPSNTLSTTPININKTNKISTATLSTNLTNLNSKYNNIPTTIKDTQPGKLDQTSPNTPKIIIKLKKSSNQEDTENTTNKQVYGPQLPPSISPIKVNNEKVPLQVPNDDNPAPKPTKNKKNKKLKLKLMKKLAELEKIDLNEDDETIKKKKKQRKKLKKRLLKLKRAEKKDKKLKRSSSASNELNEDASDKKIEENTNEEELEEDNTSLSSMSSFRSSEASLNSSSSSNGPKSSEKKKKKSKNKDNTATLGFINGLTLLKQQYGSPASSSNSSTCSSSISLSPLSSKASSLAPSPSASPTPPKSKQEVYTYNPSNYKQPLIAKEKSQSPTSLSSSANVFDEIKLSSSSSTLKTWENQKSSCLTTSSFRKRSNLSDDDYDEYNEEFDTPSAPKVKQNKKDHWKR